MLLDPISGSILRVPSPPTRLRLATPQLPTFRLAAGALPTPDPRIRPKPLPTDRARSLPGLWHGDPSSSPRRDTSAGAHIKLTGSVLESRGGSLFARAEGSVSMKWYSWSGGLVFSAISGLPSTISPV